MILWALLGVLLAVGALPGAIAGTVIGWTRGRPITGLTGGAISGMVGCVIGFVAYRQYLNTLPYEIAKRELFGPYHKVIDPPPAYFELLSVIGGSLVLAILWAAVCVSRSVSPAARAPT